MRLVVLHQVRRTVSEREPEHIGEIALPVERIQSVEAAAFGSTRSIIRLTETSATVVYCTETVLEIAQRVNELTEEKSC